MPVCSRVPVPLYCWASVSSGPRLETELATALRVPFLVPVSRVPGPYLPSIVPHPAPFVNIPTYHVLLQGCRCPAPLLPSPAPSLTYVRARVPPSRPAGLRALPLLPGLHVLFHPAALPSFTPPPPRPCAPAFPPIPRPRKYRVVHGASLVCCAPISVRRWDFRNTSPRYPSRCSTWNNPTPATHGVAFPPHSRTRDLEA